MCPICLTTAAALAAGTGATTGLAAWLLGRRVAKRSGAVPQSAGGAREERWRRRGKLGEGRTVIYCTPLRRYALVANDAVEGDAAVPRASYIRRSKFGTGMKV